MFGKRFNPLNILFLICLFGAFTAGCDGQFPEIETPQPRQTITDQREAEIDVKHIEVRADDRFIFSGSTALSEGDCVLTQLFMDSTPLDWWPSDNCFLITGTDWQFAVSLGEGGAPTELDDSAQYRLQVWWPGNPEETVDEIYFDLAGPQSP